MLEIIIGKRSYKAERSKDGTLSINGKVCDMDLLPLGNDRFHLILNGRSMEVERVGGDPKSPEIKVNGHGYSAVVKDDTDLLLERLGMNVSSKKSVKELKAPMPGLVLDIKVEPGQEIKEGEALIVLEAMKMENVLKAPADAKVKGIPVKKGDAIDKNAILISFE